MPPPPDLTRPPAGAVHVWRVGLDRTPADLERLAENLSPDERERAARFASAQARDRFVAGRGVLRAILARCLGLEAGEVHFSYTAGGRPRLDPAHHATDLQFSLAHSRGLALVAVAAGCRVGVDLEYERPLPDAERIAARFFAPEERAALRALPEEDRLRGFFLCWTRKEAWLKATSAGLGGGLSSFAVSVAPGEPARLLRAAGDPDAPTRWSLVSLEPAPGCLAALAVEGPIERLFLWTWGSGIMEQAPGS